MWSFSLRVLLTGGGDLPVGLSGRMLAVSWWLFGFLIVSTYTANLAAFLTVSRLDTSISSLDDLSKQSDIKYSAIAGTAPQEYFRRMKDIEDRFYRSVHREPCVLLAIPRNFALHTILSFRIWKELSLKSNYKPQERAKLAVWEYPMVERFTTIWESMANAKFPDTLEDAEKRVAKGGYALLSEPASKLPSEYLVQGISLQKTIIIHNS